LFLNWNNNNKVSPQWQRNHLPRWQFGKPFRYFPVISGHRRLRQMIDFLFTFSSNRVFILLGFRDLDNVNFSDSRTFRPFHAEPWVRLPACSFLLVLYSNYSCKTHPFWAVCDIQTDRRTDYGSQRWLIPPALVTGGMTIRNRCVTVVSRQVVVVEIYGLVLRYLLERVKTAAVH